MQSTSSLRRARHAAVAGGLRSRLGTTVLLLGTCSLLTDVSSEMVSAILPLYLVSTLGFMPLQYGVVDGIYQGAGAFVRLGSGFLGDRLGRHKVVASVGYGISAVCKLGLMLVGGAMAGLSALVMADRAGKGIRTAPRDAMISLSAPRQELGMAFGVHRAMDTAGALVGPLIAFLLLALAPGSFHSLFALSFIFALLGFAVISLLVQEPRQRAEPEAPPLELRAALALLRKTDFRALTLVGGVLGLATASDGFIYLVLRDRVQFGADLFPLLATGTAVLYMLLAAPLGRLADRIGRGRVLIGGYVVLLAVYCLLMAPSAGALSVIGALALLGTYYAATDGVLAAMGSARLAEDLRGSGLALLGTATSGARLLASVIFGALWTLVGVQAAITVFAAMLVVAMVVAVRGLRLAHT